MQNMETYAAARPEQLVEIPCAPLPLFDRADRESIGRAFEPAAVLPFQQAWLPETETGFSPGDVRLGWHEHSLMVFAELSDLDIFNKATGSNQRLWELGDVFDMFFKSIETESYVEFQITPHNQRLQLRYPNRNAAQVARSMRSLDEFLVSDEMFHSLTWIENGRWHIFAQIPALTVCGSNEPIENTQWHFSFARYDHTRGVKNPVISSTSLHSQPDFHRQHEWDTLIFKTYL